MAAMLTAPSEAIPVIDITPFTGPVSVENKAEVGHQQEEVARAWDRAFREHGFALVTGHGVPASHLADLESAMEAFFAMPAEAKILYTHGRYGSASGGYSGLNTEAVAQSSSGTDTVSTAKSTDPVESFAFPFPPRFFRPPPTSASASASAFTAANRAIVERLLAAASSYYTACEKLLRTLHVISARSLNLGDDDHLNRYYAFDDGQGSTLATAAGTLKLAYYPHDAGFTGKSGDSDEGTMRYGQHTDFSGFTILRPDPNDWVTAENGGLEVLHPKSGEWHQCALPRDGTGMSTLVVNAGDLVRVLCVPCHVASCPPEARLRSHSTPPTSHAAHLIFQIQRWTDDRWVSAVHRVSPRRGRAAGARSSIVFFSGPRNDTVVGKLPMDGDCSPSTMYPPISALDHLKSKLSKMQPV